MNLKIWRKPERSSGLAMVLVLIALFLIAVLGFSLGAQGVQSLVFSSDAANSNIALYAAEAGASRAVYAIEQSDSLLQTCPGIISLPNLSGGNLLQDGAQFLLTVTNNSCGTTSMLASDGTTVPAGVYYVYSTGKANRTQRTVSIFVSQSTTWPFQYAAFGNSSVILDNNSSTNSYPATGQGNVGSNGAITDNGAVSGTIVLSPGATVSPNPPPSPAIIKNQSNVTALPAVVDPQGGYNTNNNQSGSNVILNPGQYGNVTVSNNGTLTLNCNAGGGSPSYFSIGGITLNNNNNVVLGPNCSQSNPAKVYVYNTFSVQNNSNINTSGPAASLFFYGMPTLTSLTIANNSGSNIPDYFVVYAPSASITLNNNGDINGSLVGASVTVANNATLRYDLSLNTDSGAAPFTVTNVYSWNFR